jgi:hypothetical protein
MRCFGEIIVSPPGVACLAATAARRHSQYFEPLFTFSRFQMDAASARSSTEYSAPRPHPQARKPATPCFLHAFFLPSILRLMSRQDMALISPPCQNGATSMPTARRYAPCRSPARCEK